MAESEDGPPPASAGEAADAAAAALRAGVARVIGGLGLPEVTQRPSHGAPTWFVQDKRSFVTLWAEGHHDNHFPARLVARLDG
jgi:hypothetical protein